MEERREEEDNQIPSRLIPFSPSHPKVVNNRLLRPTSALLPHRERKQREELSIPGMEEEKKKRLIVFDLRQSGASLCGRALCVCV